MSMFFTRRNSLRINIKRRGGQDRDACVRFVAEKLLRSFLNDDQVNTITLDIELRATKLDSNVVGYAHYNKFDIVDKNYFLIVINRDLDAFDLYTTLAHEIKHVSQYVLGHLRPYNNSWNWRGKLYSVEEYGNEFYDCPWEVEARNSEHFGLTFMREYACR